VTDKLELDGDAKSVMKCDGGNMLDRLTGENSESVMQPPPIDEA
jgi:hypothetical protein